MSDTPLFDAAIDWNALKLGYKSTQIGSRKFKKAAILFDMAREKNLVALWRELLRETYVPSGYYRLIVYRPKERIVHAPRIRDKIVQYSVHKVLWEHYSRIYIKDTYACMKDRGVHKAADALQHYMRLCQWKYGGGWLLKLDVKKYFHSIDRELLKSILRKKIIDQKFLRLLDAILDSSPEGERGIPLGCAASQDFANIYLNELDQYAKRFLAVKWYIRYMDDVVCVFPSKEEAQASRDKMVSFLAEHLHLEASPQKTKIYPLAQGVNVLGYKIFTTHRLIRNSSKAAMKRRIKEMDRKLQSGVIDQAHIQQSVNSWLGHARHSNSYNLSKRIFGKYQYITLEDPEHMYGCRYKRIEAPD